MNIEQYLSATRKKFHIIDDTNNRFSKYISTIKSIFDENKINISFIRSNLSKTEIVFGDESWVIFDRQADLYFNSLAFPDIFSESKNSYDDMLWQAYCYIAASEFSFNKKAEISNKILKELTGTMNFNMPESIFSEMSRLHFTIFHEIGHNELQKDENLKEKTFKLVDSAFYDFFGEISFFDPQVKMWDENLKEECAVDYYSMSCVAEMMKDNTDFEIGIGGFANFSLQSLICIHRICCINIIKDIVKRFSQNKQRQKLNIDDIILRMRMTRQIFNNFNCGFIGESEAQTVHNNFTEYLNKNHENLFILFPNKLTDYIYDIDIDNIKDNISDPFSGAFDWN